MTHRPRSRFGKSVLARVATCAASCALISYVNGQILYEPFDMPAGSLGGNHNDTVGTSWTYGSTLSQDMNIVSGSIAPASGISQPIAGNSVNLVSRDMNGGTVNAVERLGIGTFTSGALYLSMRVTVSDLTTAVANGTGAFFTGFSPTPGTDTTSVTLAGARVRVQKSPTDSTKFQIGIEQDVHGGVGSGTSPSVFDPTNLDLNTPVLIVARYQFNQASVGDDVATVWVNPASSAFGSPDAPASALTSTGCDTWQNTIDPVPTIKSIFFRQNSVSASSLSIDDFRVGLTWASVTPQTGSTWASTSDTSWGGSNWTGAVPDAVNAYAYFDDTTSVHNVALGGTRTVGSLYITTASGYTLSGGNLVFDGGMGATAHGSSQLTVNGVKDPTFATFLSANNTIASPVTLNNDLYVSVGASQSLTMSGNIVESVTSSLAKFGAGTLVLSGSNSYSGTTSIYSGTLAVSSNAISGSGSITFAGGVLKATDNLSTGAAVLLQDAIGTIDTGANTVTLNGVIGQANLTRGLAKLGSGTLILNASNTYLGGTTVRAGTVVLGKNSQTPVLSGGGATINAGQLIMDYSGAGTDPTSTIVGDLQANLGSDNTAGIVRTGNTADPNKGIGYFDDTTHSRAIFRYTYRGDANLDGVVNALDFNALASNFGAANSAWVQGDFNYDGTVDTSDFTYLAATFNMAPLSSAVPSSVASALVPEPVSTALVAGLGCCLMRRRVKRNRLQRSNIDRTAR